jgi:hypothetical protein
MILRLTTVHENARSALECGGLTPPSPLGLYALGTPRRCQAATLQGAFGTVIFMATRNLALPRTHAWRDSFLRSKVKARIGGTPSPGPPPDEVHRDCGPPCPPRGRGTFNSVGGRQAHDHSE